MRNIEIALELLYQQIQELSREVVELRKDIEDLKKKINIYE